MTSWTRMAATLAVLMGTTAASAGSWGPFPFQPESKLWIEGTSNVRNFTCRAGNLEGNVEATPGTTRLVIPALQNSVRAVTVAVPVASLECGNGTMNSHLRKAL